MSRGDDVRAVVGRVYRTEEVIVRSRSDLRYVILRQLLLWFGEVGLAAILACVFAIPVGIFLAGRAEITIAFISAAGIFLPHFTLLPKRMQKATAIIGRTRK